MREINVWIVANNVILKIKWNLKTSKRKKKQLFCNLFLVNHISSNKYHFQLRAFPANIYLDEDVLKIYWRRLSSSFSEDVYNTSFRSLHQNEYIRLSPMFSEDDLIKTNIVILVIHLQDVFRMSSRSLVKISLRRLQNVFKTYHQVKLFLLTRLQDIFHKYSTHFCEALRRWLSREWFAYNLGNNLLRLFDALLNFPFSTSEMNRDH